MKYQTNEELGVFINKWGCHICSVLCKAEVTSRRFGKYFKFSNSDVGAVYLAGMEKGFIQAEEYKDGKPFDGCSVLDGARLFNLAASMFDLPVVATRYRWENKDYTPKEGEEELLELKRTGMQGSHFVCGNGSGGIEFDPIEGGSQAARLGWVESKRILTVRRV
jgi:hypothetical protein